MRPATDALLADHLRQLKLTAPEGINRPALIGVIRDAVAKQTLMLE